MRTPGTAPPTCPLKLHQALDGPDLHWQARISFSYRTPHPAFRLASSRGTRRWPKGHASKAQHAERSADLIVGEPLCAAPLHLVPLAQERANTAPEPTVRRG